MGWTLAHIRSMSDDELVIEHDKRAQHVTESPEILRQELQRRALDRATRRMERLTIAIAALTVAIAALTVASVVISTIALVQAC